MSLTDEAYKIVISRLGNRLRAAGTAELTGYDTQHEPGALRGDRAAHRRAVSGAERRSRATIAGPACARRRRTTCRSSAGTKLSNLYLNTGHGTLGWTLACGSGSALADLVSGRKPQVDFRFHMRN